MRTLRTAALLAVALLLMMGAAQATTGATIQTATDATYGLHLTDADGNSLYLYTQDTPQASTCVDACATNWPAFTTDGDPVAGDGVDAALLGTLARADGSVQVTYAGAPLYRYVRDAKPGAINGQRLGGVFFLVSPQGKAIQDAVAQAAPTLSDAELAALMSEGQQTFTANCAVCHGDQGQGKVGPAFDKNANLGNTNYVIDTILGGIPPHGMPAWGGVLTDEQIASVATFIRNSWSNAYGPVTQDAVTAQR